MKTKPESIKQQVLPLVFQAGGGILVALVFWLVIGELPMVEDIQLPVEFTLTELLSAGILTIIMGILVSFGMRMEACLAAIVTGFPQSGQILKLFIFLIVIGIAYGAYLPLLEPYWGDVEWVYPVFFLVVFLVVMGILGYTIYQHMDRLGTLLYQHMDRLGTLLVVAKQTVATPAAAGDIACAGCGEKNKIGATFCSSCGASLSVPETVASNCKGCGAALKPNARFCVSCGLTVGKAASEAD